VNVDIHGMMAATLIYKHAVTLDELGKYANSKKKRNEEGLIFSMINISFH